jgi:endoglucanase
LKKRQSFARPGAGIEPLEHRQMLTSPYSWTTQEVESNARRSSATSAAIAYDGITRIQGVSKSSSDVDYFVLQSDRTSALRVSVTNLNTAQARVRVEAESGAVLLETGSSGRLFLGPGKKYFFRIVSSSTGRASYSVKLEAPATTVSDTRFATLRKGVNIPGWFWNFDPSNGIEDPFRDYISESDARQMKQLGIRHVRVPIDVKHVMNWDTPTKFNAITMQRIREGVNRLTRNGVAVILCPFGDHQNFVVRPGNLQRAIDFTAAWTRHWSDTDPEMVFLQVANEPDGDPSIWQPVHRELMRVMRENASTHTFISATPLKFGPQSNAFGTVEALTQTVPLTDKNVVYSLHFYEPFLFTHQGVQFGPAGYEYLNNVPYPADTNNTLWVADKLRNEISDLRFKYTISDSVRYYGQSGWDRERIFSRVKAVADWAKFYGVRVIADEFGTVDEGDTNPVHRETWLKDVREAFEFHNIAWSTWDYDQGFSLVTGGPGQRTLKRGTLKALGFNVL